MRRHFARNYNRLMNGEKIPRKAKKIILGKRMSKTQIKSKLRTMKITQKIKTIYDGFDLNNEPFCLECGCKVIRWSGNRADYPDLWDVGYCARCGHKVAEADNSPYYHEIYEYLFEKEYESC